MARVVLNVFPARVELSDGQTVDPARFIALDTRYALVFGVESGRAKLFFREPYVGLEPPSSAYEPYMVQLVSNDIWKVFRRGGCGCRSPLQYLNLEDLQ